MSPSDWVASPASATTGWSWPRPWRAGSACVRHDGAGLLAVAEADDGTAPIERRPLRPAREWAGALAGSPLVADGADGPDDRPVRVVGTRVYLDRYWRDELLVRTEV